jgi:hypothetical protein
MAEHTLQSVAFPVLDSDQISQIAIAQRSRPTTIAMATHSSA